MAVSGLGEELPDCEFFAWGWGTGGRGVAVVSAWWGERLGKNSNPQYPFSLVTDLGRVAVSQAWRLVFQSWAPPTLVVPKEWHIVMASVRWPPG